MADGRSAIDYIIAGIITIAGLFLFHITIGSWLIGAGSGITISIFALLQKTLLIVGGILLVGYLVFAMLLGEDRKELLKRFNSVRNTYIRNAFADLTKRIFTKLPFLRRSFMRLRNIEGREPEIVFRNRLLFMRLLDQELRFDIFYKKYLYVIDYHNFLKGESSIVGRIPRATSMEDLKKQIIALRSQKGKLNVGEDVIGEDADPNTPMPNFIGWNYMNKIIVDYMNMLIKFMMENIKKIEQMPVGDEKERANKNEAIDEFRNRISFIGPQQISAITAAIEASKSQYNQRLEVFPHHYMIRAYTLWLLDMFNVSGDAGHTYLFAREGAEYYDENNSLNKVRDTHTQVTIFGEFKENLGWKLKNPKADTVYFPKGENMGEIAEYFVRDWLGLIRDLRIGIYHQHSRNVKEYEEAWNEGIWNDDKIPWDPRGGSNESPAFDLRALANPGLYKFAGKYKYFDMADNVRQNSDPHISQFGIKQFILRLIERTSRQVSDDKQFLANYPADTGEEIGSLEEYKKGRRPIGYFEERSE